ncbi:hypothetical protein AGOR_G00047370 [Albula goreensis]|uniref:Uncharacterized protein n=1 Tax=Albula goreensis TaxID=1534307 RepID=A0A8T3DTK5_9TELE|nr:hypothetical protein AGOR_G00047370 [Albula goreensis]
MEGELQDVNNRRTVALCALPINLREEDSQFFKTFSVEENEIDIADTPVAVLTLVTENITDPFHFNPTSTAIVVEDEVILKDLPWLNNGDDSSKMEMIHYVYLS